ncbi:MAG: UDP-N-acetylmuramoyl-L-alanine--D-glutamate ligase [Candidatus Taylorbacteria bacterium]|nr:UDP-N-acetylmuramoyl-L-alanine--D-glutamate ligase [Candidatus Taylorbacteria bacterium]
MMISYKDYFKGKKVTILGLGLLGRGLGDAIFLAECGANLIVTDLRDAKTLAPSLVKLNRYKNIQYTIGEHKLDDFRNRDFILKAAGVALDSPYIAEAQKNKIPVEMDASLFAKLMPKGVTLVGVTGTRGKSTTTALIYEILSSSVKGQVSKINGSVYKGGNLVSEATLPLLKKVKSGDIIVLELDSWQLQGFHEAKISPHVAVFTTFLDDHLIYYKGDTERYFEDKVAIFKYQNSEGLLIAGEQVAKNIGKSGVTVNGDFVIAKKEDVPSEWTIPIPGEHNLENIACALAVAKHFKIPEAAVKKAVEHFKPVAGRLELIRTVKGVKFYNDTNATTPDATIAGLRALGKGKNIVLICGGTDKGLDMSKLVAEIPKHCKGLVLLKETGTEKLKPLIQETGFNIQEKETLEECVEEAVKLAKKGDIVLFSPAFASFGKWFKNEYDRGEQFLKIVKKLKG